MSSKTTANAKLLILNNNSYKKPSLFRLSFFRPPALILTWLLGFFLLTAALNLGLGWQWQAFCQQLPWFDKVAHLLLYSSSLVLVYHWCWLKGIILDFWSVILLGLVIATMDEMTHGWIASRAFEGLDLAGNYSGVIFGALIIRIKYEVRKPSHFSISTV